MSGNAISSEAASDVLTDLKQAASDAIATADTLAGPIIATGADTVTGCDSACLMNIADALKRRGSSIRVAHLVQLLAEGL